MPQRFGGKISARCKGSGPSSDFRNAFIEIGSSGHCLLQRWRVIGFFRVSDFSSECSEEQLSVAILSHNCDGGDFVIVESGNGEPQQLLVNGEGRALFCHEQFDGPDRNS
jgi:hypothetical protein